MNDNSVFGILFSLVCNLPIIFRLLLITAVLLILLYLFPIIRVVDDSMYPTYKDGNIILGTRLFNKNKCKEGKVYVIHLRDEEDGEPYFIIKRLLRRENIEGYIYYDFRGDNKVVSYDSRQHGVFYPKSVVAKVLFSRKNAYERGAKK